LNNCRNSWISEFDQEKMLKEADDERMSRVSGMGRESNGAELGEGSSSFTKALSSPFSSRLSPRSTGCLSPKSFGQKVRSNCSAVSALTTKMRRGTTAAPALPVPSTLPRPTSDGALLGRGASERTTKSNEACEA
jgi:hypothetical protein